MSTLFDRVGRPAVKLRRDASPAEVKAANKALGKSGSHREWAFYQVWRSHPVGVTSVELAYRWAEDHPCVDCGCTHRLPIPVNQWGARLLELRESGYVTWRFTGSDSVIRSAYGREAQVHVLTGPGVREAHRRYDQ